MNKIKAYLLSKYKDLLIIISFIITYIIIYLILTKNGSYYFASSKDFDVQHYLLPDYLREIFINSHSLFPKFSFNLASGTNIFNLAYYGLFSPIILISFLFPKIKMINYIIGIMSVIVILSTILLYIYLRKNKYSYMTSFVCAFLFLCSGPLIFHSHRHIMFIDYFPFLILGIFGTDLYIKNKKSLLLIVSIVLMIFTSYFYSVSSLFVLLLYAIYKYININEKVKLKQLINFMIGLIVRYFSSILIASFFLIPTAFALLNGRSSSNNSNILGELFTLKNNLLYQPYTMGLTIISLVSILYLIFKGKKANRFLAIILLVCSFIPLPSLIFNGFLYVDGKSLIPFIPLVIILIAEFLDNALFKTRFKYFILIYLLLSSFTVCIMVNNNDKLILKKSINISEDNIYKDKINNIINNNDIYRIKNDLLGKEYINRITNINEYKTSSYLSSNNKYFNNMYKYTYENPLMYRNNMMYSSSNNLLFEIAMGEKYIFSRNNYNKIYNKIDSYNDINIYENKYVLPIGYATKNYININDYNKLSYPDNIVNSLGTVISNNKTNIDIKRSNEVSIDYNIIDYSNLSYEKTDYGYIIKSKKNGILKLKSNYDFNNKLLLIQFELDDRTNCMYSDLRININSINNVLTCKNWKYYNDNRIFSYTITEDPNYLTINLDKGTYKIHNIKLYTIDYKDILSSNNEIYPMIIDKNGSDQDTIRGNINVLDDSYFILSIPYDDGFVVKLDRKIVKYELANDSFIGFPIKKGKHSIEISYVPKGYNLGIILSFVGIISFMTILIYEKKKL